MSFLGRWIKTHMVPALFEFGFEHNNLVLAQDSPVVILFMKGNAELNSTYMDVYRKAAQELEGTIVFSYVTLKDPFQFSLLNFLEVQPTELPILTALKPKDHLRYHAGVKPEHMSSAYIGNWARAVLSGE